MMSSIMDNGLICYVYMFILWFQYFVLGFLWYSMFSLGLKSCYRGKNQTRVPWKHIETSLGTILDLISRLAIRPCGMGHMLVSSTPKNLIEFFSDSVITEQCWSVNGQVEHMDVLCVTLAWLLWGELTKIPLRSSMVEKGIKKESEVNSWKGTHSY